LSSLHRGKHWYLTHQLAFYILRRFQPNLKIEDARHYFAHANSAKCNQGKVQNAQADSVLFQNCRSHLRAELMTLRPEIIVTQGSQAKWALEAVTEQHQVLEDGVAVRRLDGRPMLWLHTFHPRYFGGFSRQRAVKEGVATGWERLADQVEAFMDEAIKLQTWRDYGLS
jgi:hypothetical protein